MRHQLALAGLFMASVAQADVGELLEQFPAITAIELRTGSGDSRDCAPEAQRWFAAADPQPIRCVMEEKGSRCWAVVNTSLDTPCVGLKTPVPVPQWMLTAASMTFAWPFLVTNFVNSGATDLRPSAVVLQRDDSWLRIKGHWYRNPAWNDVVPGWSLDLSALVGGPALGLVTNEGGSGSGMGNGNYIFTVLSVTDGELKVISKLSLGEWSWSRGDPESGQGIRQSWDMMKPTVVKGSLVLAPGPHPRCLSSYCGSWHITRRKSERCSWHDAQFVCIEK